jgi:phospholipid transport system substrate-binding protein
MMRAYGIVVACLAIAFGTSLSRAEVVADKGPNELIESVAQSLLKELDARRDELQKDPQGVRELVDEHMLPHFDTEYAARLVLARHWRDATPEQRKRFVNAFYQSMLQNYGEALLEFTPDRLTVLPFRGDPEADRATVRTEVRRDNGTKVPVNYTLRRTPEGWKAWDVTIEGISYIKSFRTDFGSEIDQKGLDAVIERLETQDVKAPQAQQAARAAE